MNNVSWINLKYIMPTNNCYMNSFFTILLIGYGVILTVQLNNTKKQASYVMLRKKQPFYKKYSQQTLSCNNNILQEKSHRIKHGDLNPKGQMQYFQNNELIKGFLSICLPRVMK